MTKQEAAALLRDAARNASHESVALLDSEALAIADLLDPPREGLAKVQIALAWGEDGDFNAVPFGPNTWNATFEDAEISLGEAGDYIAPTIITAYVPRPARTVTQVEGEVEG